MAFFFAFYFFFNRVYLFNTEHLFFVGRCLSVLCNSCFNNLVHVYTICTYSAYSGVQSALSWIVLNLKHIVLKINYSTSSVKQPFQVLLKCCKLKTSEVWNISQILKSNYFMGVSYSKQSWEDSTLHIFLTIFVFYNEKSWWLSSDDCPLVHSKYMLVASTQILIMWQWGCCNGYKCEDQ